MSAMATEAWVLSDRVDCVCCTGERPGVDLNYRLSDGRDGGVCTECVERLAKVAKLGTAAIKAVLDQQEAELADRDESIRKLAGKLGEAEQKAAQADEQTEQYRDELHKLRWNVNQALGILQLVGR